MRFALALLSSMLVACGSEGASAPPAHPSPECIDGEQDFHPPIDLDISGPGAATADFALRADLEAASVRLGTGDIVVLEDTEYALVGDERVVAIRQAITNTNGEWHVVEFFYCSTDETGARRALAEPG